ncbi:immune inhibitor A domain-containing protein [Paenibacillus sp. GYB003]|uniref:immune inhibitor A domain-containing protein n=1 Tax=Paenibacillus sp. GYB003 TaxID=2994392 RepID=UPI002F964877
MHAAGFEAESPVQEEMAIREQNRFAEGVRKMAEMRSLTASVYGPPGQFGKNGLTGGGVSPATPEPWNGPVREAKLLVLLIEFPDYYHNSLKPEETSHYYPDYSNQHYENMIFSPNGYTGPNGEALQSVRQYYEEQSGGSYTLTGQVGGWYKAKKSASYYGANTETQQRYIELVKEALEAAAQDPTVDLTQFDVEDRYDLDKDGIYDEPDGVIDHLYVIHSGLGEETGGGLIGTDALWARRWSMLNFDPIPGSTMKAFNYMVVDEAVAPGILAHEYAHDLGLPDERPAPPISYWSIMDKGAWAGKPAGTSPSGFNPWDKAFLQATLGGNWSSGTAVNAEALSATGLELLLDQASMKGTNNDVIRVNLPTRVATVQSATYAYFSGRGNGVDSTMTAAVDLRGRSQVWLNFKASYHIVGAKDLAAVEVKPAGATQWTSVPGNLTNITLGATSSTPVGIRGKTYGTWVDAAFNLSAYAGQQIELRIRFTTDSATYTGSLNGNRFFNSRSLGLYVDDLRITADGNVLLTDNAEGVPAFTLNGFIKSDGIDRTIRYYLLEWRTHTGFDAGLSSIRYGNGLSYDEGLLVWYVDETYGVNNWTMEGGFLGVVDADQHVLKWSDGSLGELQFQLHDAAFNTSDSSPFHYDVSYKSISDTYVQAVPLFDDSNSYRNPLYPDAGRVLPQHGLKIEVVEKSADGSAAKIRLYR